MTKILIVDPLTLLGRETLLLLADDPALSAEVGYVHTGEDDEHQIAELGGEPALVPPLDGLEQLSDAEAVLVASDVATARTSHLLQFADQNPATPFVVMGRLPGDWDRMPPAAGRLQEHGASHFRVAHPALVMLRIITESLRFLDPVRATVAALDPVSSGGAEDVERLARQGAQRLQGADVSDLIGDRVLAFNLVVADDEDLNRDLSLLLPDLEVAATRVATGCFHGNAAQITLGFASPVEEHEVLEALRDDERLAEPDLPLSLDAITESDLIGVSLPRLSPGGRLLSVTAIADGLRIGGARTALEILRSLL